MATVPAPSGMFPAAFRTLAVVIAGGELFGVLLLTAQLWFPDIASELVNGWSAWAAPAGAQAGTDTASSPLAITLTIVFGLVAAFLAGEVVDVASTSLVSVLERDEDDNYRPCVYRLVGPDYSSRDWALAQQWIWESRRAHGEFGQLRFRLMVSRDTAFNLFLASLVCWVGVALNPIGGDRLASVSFAFASAAMLPLPFLACARRRRSAFVAMMFVVAGASIGGWSAWSWARPRDGLAFAALLLLPVMVWVFFFVWAKVGAIYNDLVRAAGSVGPPES